MSNNLSNNPEHITINSLNEDGRSKMKNSMSYSKYDEICNDNSGEIKKENKEKLEYLETNNKITAAVTNQTNVTEVGLTEEDRGLKSNDSLRDKIKEKKQENSKKDIILVFDEKTRQLTLSNNSPSRQIIIQHKPDDSIKAKCETKEVQTENDNISMQDLKGKCKFVMIKDEHSKSTYLVNSNFVYPIPEWKYGNQYQASLQSTANNLFSTAESDYTNLKPMSRSQKSNFSEYKDSKLSNPIKELRNLNKENLDDTSNFYFPYTNTASDFTFPHEAIQNPNFQHKYSSIVNDHKTSDNRSYITHPVVNIENDISNYKGNMSNLNNKINSNVNSYDNFTLQAEPIDDDVIATVSPVKQLNLNSNMLVTNSYQVSRPTTTGISNSSNKLLSKDESSQPYIRKVNPLNKFQSN